MNLAEEIEAALSANLDLVVDVVGQAWAQAAQAEAPVDSEGLKLSIHYEKGFLVLRRYGVYVSRGHKVARWNTRTSPRPPSQPLKTTGFVPPNDFLSRAWQSQRVQAILREVPYIIMTRGR